jgi:F5/8 type C domain-containing protein
LHLILMILILSSLGYSTNLSAFPSLKSSSIDNKYDIPIGIPIETSTPDLSINTKANLQNTNYSLESLPEELHLLEGAVSTLATCEKLPVTSVNAIGNDGNIPSNVIDNNLNTRWSNNGVGSWIQLDLGSKKGICSIDIAWYRGDVRQNNFVVSVSDDGNTFTNKFSGSSSGSTPSLEKYTMPAGTEGRYVRITVNGNSESSWASITEIAVFGSIQSSANTPGPLLHRSQTSAGGNAWSPWGSLGGEVRGDSQPAVIKNADGRLTAFIVNSDNAVYYKRQTLAGSATWSGWTNLGGNVRAGSEIAVGMNSDNRLALFMINADNKVFYKRQTLAGSDNWSGWTNLGGNVRAGSEIAVSKYSDGRLVVFIINSDNAVYYRQQSAPGSDTWSGWAYLGGNVRDNSNPVVGINNDGRLEVFQVGAGATTPPPPTSTDFPYTLVGTPTEMEDEGQGTRHYASGKPDDVTHEWSDETSAPSYVILIDITLTEIDHDDEISFKYGGTHMGTGWYDNGYSFEDGQACLGKEEDHPSTDLCEITGNSIGNLVNTPVKLAAININKGEKLELWSNLGSGWTKDVEGGPGVTGFRPQADTDETVVRIDAAPGIEMRSAIVQEIDPASAGITAPAPAPAPTPTPTSSDGDEEQSNLDQLRSASTGVLENAQDCYDAGYADGKDHPFDGGANDLCRQFPDNQGNPYYRGFIGGCMSVKGNTMDVCESAPD